MSLCVLCSAGLLPVLNGLPPCSVAQVLDASPSFAVPATPLQFQWTALTPEGVPCRIAGSGAAVASILVTHLTVNTCAFLRRAAMCRAPPCSAD
jgi:hypothetical protein